MRQKKFWYKNTETVAPLLLSKKDARIFAHAFLKNTRMETIIEKQKPVAGKFLPARPLDSNKIRAVKTNLINVSDPVFNSSSEHLLQLEA